MLKADDNPPGTAPLAIAVPGHSFVEEAKKRGFNIEVRFSGGRK
jgi:hypothetical protein